MQKIGIIGSNFGVKVLLPAFASTKNCVVSAICAKPSKELSLFLKKHPKLKIYSTWQSMLKEEALDAVAIAVVPKAQYSIAKKAIEKGLNVFAEKPLAATAVEAKQLLSLAQKKKIVHAVDFTFPEITQWQKVKALLESGTYGRLQNVSVNWNWLAGDIKAGIKSWKTSVKEGGGILSLYFSHGLYYLEYFVGPIASMTNLFTYSKESLNGAESGIDLSFTFKNGVTGNAHVHGNSRGVPRHQLIFQCERGVIILENKNAIVDNFTVTVITEGKEKVLRIAKDKGRHNEDSRVKIARKPIERFVQACIKKKQTFPSFTEGLRVQQLIERARKNL